MWVPAPPSMLLTTTRHTGTGTVTLYADDTEEVNHRAWERHQREEFERERRERLVSVEAQRVRDTAPLDAPPS